MKTLSQIDLFECYKSWSSLTGSFKCFFRPTNFVTLKHYPDFELCALQGDSYSDSLFQTICKSIETKVMTKTLLLLDVSGKRAINTAYRLRSKKSIIPVLVFNGVLHEYGLVGDKEYISQLLSYGEQFGKLQHDIVNGYAFVLDCDRYDDYNDDQLRTYFNNQYELCDEDLPSVELLTLMGIEEVLFFHEKFMEDIAGYTDYLKDNGISIESISV